MANDQNSGYGTGRRKTAVARVRLQPGDGRITINEKPALQYLGRRTLELVVMTPFKVVDTKRFDANVKVVGGGKSGQAGAVAHGVARALLENDPELRPVLKKAGFLSRDQREKESKKYGLKKARKAPQYSKR